MRVKYKKVYEVSYYTNQDIYKIKYKYNNERELLKTDDKSFFGSHKIERQTEIFDTKEDADMRADELRQKLDTHMVRIKSLKSGVYTQ